MRKNDQRAGHNDDYDNMALATRQPTEQEYRHLCDVMEADKGSVSHESLALTYKYYGIDPKNVRNLQVCYLDNSKHLGNCDNHGNISVSPYAMYDDKGDPTPGKLAHVLVHETTHANQLAAERAGKYPFATINRPLFEQEATEAQLQSSRYTGFASDGARHYQDVWKMQGQHQQKLALSGRLPSANPDQPLVHPDIQHSDRTYLVPATEKDQQALVARRRELKSSLKEKTKELQSREPGLDWQK